MCVVIVGAESFRFREDEPVIPPDRWASCEVDVKRRGPREERMKDEKTTV
jgi:hypothetical protein